MTNHEMNHALDLIKDLKHALQNCSSPEIIECIRELKVAIVSEFVKDAE